MANYRTPPANNLKASKAAVWAAMLTIYIVWGSTYLAIRFAVGTIPPFLMNAARFLTAGVLLLVIRRALGDPLPRHEEWGGAAFMGLFLLVGGTGAVSWAEQSVPSGLTALLISTSPLWMMIFEALLPHGRRPTRASVLGILAGFGGVLLLFWPGSGSLMNVNPAGAFALLFATLSWAFGSVYSRKLSLPASPMMGSAAEMLVGGAVCLLLGVAAGEPARVSLASVSPASAAGLAYLILVGSLLAFSAYSWLLRVAPTSLVSTYAYVNPLVALVLGALIGNESLSPRALAAAVIIIGSVAATTMMRRSEPASPTSSPVEPE